MYGTVDTNSSIPLSVLSGHKVLLFSEKREEFVQTLKSILDNRLVFKNRSRVGLQRGHKANGDDRETEKLHVVCWIPDTLTEFGGVAEIGPLPCDMHVHRTDRE